MKAFGVRFAAGTLTILLGAIMAAQAQKDQQATTEAAWTEQQLPESEPPMPIGLMDQITSGDLDTADEHLAENDVISNGDSSEPADFFDQPGAVTLVQHTEPAMGLPAMDSVQSDKPTGEPKATFQFPTFDEAPEIKSIESADKSNPSDSPAFSMGLPSVPADSGAAGPSGMQDPPSIGEVTFADTPGAKPSVDFGNTSPAMGADRSAVPVNDLRGSNPAFGGTMRAEEETQGIAAGVGTPPDFGQAIAQLTENNEATPQSATSDGPSVRLTGQGPVQVGIGEPISSAERSAAAMGGANQNGFAVDPRGLDPVTEGMQAPPSSFEPPAAIAPGMRSAEGSSSAPAANSLPFSSPPYNTGPNNSAPYSPAGSTAFDATESNAGPGMGMPAARTGGVPYSFGQSNAEPPAPLGQSPVSQTPFGQPSLNASAPETPQYAAPGQRFASEPAVAGIPANAPAASPNAYPTQPAAYNQNQRGTPFSTASSQLDRLPAPPSRFEGVTGSVPGSASLSMATPGEHRLDGPQNAAVVINKRAPGEVKVGRPASFVITVQNVGAVKATDVRVFDRIPTGTKLEDSTPPPNPKFQPELYWELGDMEPGEERVITLQLVPMQEGELGSVATVAYRASASVRTVSTRPELKVVQRAPERVLIGQQVEIELEVSNPGTGEATGVVIQEDVPEGLLHPQGKKLDSVIGTLGPGQIRRQILRMKAVKPGLIENLIRVKGDDGLETAHTVALEVIAPDLRVGLAGPSRRYLERQATYEVKVANAGTADAQNLELSVQLDRGFTFVKTNNQGQYDPSRHAVFWSLHSLPAGTDASVDLTLLPVEEGTRLLRTDASADLGITAFVENQVRVDSLAELTFSISDTSDPIEIGGQTVYEIRVNNSGSRDDTNVEVALQLPQGLQLVEEGDFTPKGQGFIAFPPRALLKANDEMVFRVKAQGITPGRHLVKAVVRSDQSDVPVTKEESIMVYSDR